MVIGKLMSVIRFLIGKIIQRTELTKQDTIFSIKEKFKSIYNFRLQTYESEES